MSVDALASSWARQENAPHGSVVTVATEISGRLRGGVPWTRQEPAALMMAMVARPRILPTQESLLWLVVTVASARAVSRIGGSEKSVVWPDTILAEGGNPVCSTNVTVQLGAGRIDHAVLAVRADLAALEIPDREREPLLASLVRELQSASELLESDPLSLVDAFTERCAMMDQLVKVTLLPRGTARGRVVAIDPNGDLMLESATGMLERIMPSSLRDVELSDG